MNELGDIWVLNKNGAGFQVRTKNNIGTVKDLDFSFVVYKK